MSGPPLAAPRPTRLMDIVFPGDTNHHGTLFGGVGLACMDKVAFIAASRHARVDFVTASCERIDFVAPAHLGEIIELTGRVVRVGKRSLGAEVELVAEAPLSGERRLCSRGVFNMVAAGNGANGGSHPLPPLPPSSPSSPSPSPSPPDGASQEELCMAEIVFPGETSHYGSLYGGNALAAMGKAAFIAATRHCRKTVVMASSRRVDFASQIQKGEIIYLAPRVVKVGHSSMTVEVRLSAENPQSGKGRVCGGGVFVMVAVNARHQPVAALALAA